MLGCMGDGGRCGRSEWNDNWADRKKVLDTVIHMARLFINNTHVHLYPPTYIFNNEQTSHKKVGTMRCNDRTGSVLI